MIKLKLITENSQFADEAVKFSKFGDVHKGLEAKYVYILYPPVQLKPEYQDQIDILNQYFPLSKEVI